MALTTDFQPIDGMTMRRTMGGSVSGVAVVTADEGAEKVGMTISSLSSISLDPPILMISLNYNTRTGDAIAASGRFAVSMLGINQEAVARQFAVRGGARFEEGTFDATPHGLPVISGALAQIDCEVSESHGIGDHEVIFGKVVSSRNRDGEALCFKGGRFGSFTDFHHEQAPWLF